MRRSSTPFNRRRCYHSIERGARAARLSIPFCMVSWGGPVFHRGTLLAVADTSIWSLTKAQGISIREVSRRTGLSEGHLSDLFNGKRGGTLKTFLRLVDGSRLDPIPLLRALVRAREEHLVRRKVRRVLDAAYADRFAASR